MSVVEADTSPPTYNPGLIAANANAFYNLRVATSVIAGCVAGVLGLTNSAGAIAYLVGLLAARPEGCAATLAFPPLTRSTPPDLSGGVRQAARGRDQVLRVSVRWSGSHAHLFVLIRPPLPTAASPSCWTASSTRRSRTCCSGRACARGDRGRTRPPTTHTATSLTALSASLPQARV